MEEQEQSSRQSWLYSRTRSPWIRYGQWIVIPLLVLFLAEKAAKPWVIQREKGYYTAMNRPASGHIDAVFIGSSQIEAAIEPEAFDSEVSKATGKPFQSQKFGIGGIRSLAVHYMGLRNLFHRYPDQYRGCTVFLEAPFEHPSAVTWTDPWFSPGSEKVVLANVRAEDIPQLFAAEPGTLHGIELRALLWARYSQLSYYRVLLRWRIIDKVEVMGVKTANKFHLLKQADPEGNLDLVAGGILRTDPVAIAIGHNSASHYGDEIVDLRPVTDWNKTIVGDIHQLAVANGGKFVLFQMPKHSIFAPVFALPKQQVDIESLKVARAEWHVEMLHPTFKYDDSDFQDYWHVRHSRSAEFTRDLAEAWMRSGQTR